MRRHPALLIAALLITSLLTASCGGGSDRPVVPAGAAPPTQPQPTPPTSPQPATVPKIYLTVLENRSYEAMVGSPNMPFLNSLISTKAVADNFFANTHPSIGNYFMLTTGQIITNDNSFSGTVNQDNLVRELNAAGKTWRVFAESLPSVGYLGGDTGPYVKRHNPFAYFSDVVSSSTQAQNIVPFSEFSAALGAGSTADFNYILPNQNNNMHDCPAGMIVCTDADKERAADQWLQTNLTPLLNNADFQQRGLLIITMDESFDTDTANGGGHIVTVLAGPKAKDAYRSSVLYQHQSTLRLICDLLGCPVRPGASASAPSMSEFLK